MFLVFSKTSDSLDVSFDGYVYLSFIIFLNSFFSPRRMTQMDFKHIVMSRYATKSFDGTILPDAKVDELLELIRFAPSSFNLQPWKIFVITDPAIKVKLQEASWNQPQLTSCSHVLLFCANVHIRSNIEALEQAMPDATAYIQMMRDFESGLTQEQKVSWAQRQVYIALSNALNGAKALGFDSCPMEGFDPTSYAKILQLPEHLVPTVVCPIGIANDSAPAKFRFDDVVDKSFFSK